MVRFREKQSEYLRKTCTHFRGNAKSARIIRVCIQQHRGRKMQRKHVHIPDALDARAKACAEKLEMSLAEFIRRAIEAMLEKHEA
jgi:hypothetical protein